MVAPGTATGPHASRSPSLRSRPPATPVADRFATGAAVSAHTFSPGVDVAYIATAYNFPDALAGAAAAGTIKGPVLLVAPTGAINASTATELTRLKPAKIIVLGSTGVVSAQVMTDLARYTAGTVVRYCRSRPLCHRGRRQRPHLQPGCRTSPTSRPPTTSPMPSPGPPPQARSRARCSWSRPQGPSTRPPRPSSQDSSLPRSSCWAPPAWSRPR